MSDSNDIDDPAEWSEQFYSCPCCVEGKMFVQNSEIIMVKSDVSDEPQLYCLKCDKRFSDINEFTEHESCLPEAFQTDEADDIPITYVCQMCSKPFDDQNSFCNHKCYDKVKRSWKLRRKKEATDCSVCKKAFPSIVSLRRHVSNCHSMVHYMCQVCDKTFAKKYLLKIHFRSHTGVTPYPCNSCGRRFPSSAMLWNHQKFTHSEKGHKCTSCSDLFPTKQMLGNHIRMKHTQDRSLCCEDCGKTFLNTSVFYQHKATHSDVRKHGCESCSQRFKRLSTLRKHELIHRGVKPHLCLICGKEFRQRGDLKKHCNSLHPGQLNYVRRWMPQQVNCVFLLTFFGEMEKFSSDFTVSYYTNNLWIKQIVNLRQLDGKFFHCSNGALEPVRFVTLFGIIGEFRHIAEKCVLYTVDDGTGLIQCRYNASTKDVDELEDWNWKDFNVSKISDSLGESFAEKSKIEEDTIFNDETVQLEDKLANSNSRLKLLDALRWSVRNSLRSHEDLQIGDFVCIHGRVYSFIGNIQIHVNVIRPITMIEELMLMSSKLADCGLLPEVGRVEEPSTSQVNTDLTGIKRKRASGLMTFDTIEETKIRAKPRTDVRLPLPPSPQIIPGSLTYSTCVSSAVTFDTMILEGSDGSSDDDCFIQASP